MQKSSAVQKFTKIVNSAAIRTFIDEETKTESKTVSPKSLSQICLLQKSVKAAPTKNQPQETALTAMPLNTLLSQPQNVADAYKPKLSCKPKNETQKSRAISVVKTVERDDTIHIEKRRPTYSKRGGETTSNASAIKSVKPKKLEELLDFERAIYGDRCPVGFEKLQLLGKGGCAIVWLAKEMATGLNVALKQFPKPKSQKENQNLPESARTEIEVGRELFMKGQKFNGFAVDANKYPGIKMIARLLDVIEDAKDFWLVYEVGAQPLTKLLFEVKGETYKGERIYGVNHQEFYAILKEDKEILRDFIFRLAQIFEVLTLFRIVHADIKPDNILIALDAATHKIADIKLIDFGSAFSYENPTTISASTPEYLAPEVLEYLENRGQNTEANGTNSTNLCRVQDPWSYDTWSLGIILLEIITGIPVWMSLKCRAQTTTGKSVVSFGILGVQGRDGKKIFAKQQHSLKSLEKTLRKYECYGLEKDPDFMDLLLRMLDPNPRNRPSPIEIQQHPFVQQ